MWVELERQSADADALLTEVLKLHPLTIEDIWGPRSQPKIDDFDAYLYVIVHGIGASRRTSSTLVEIDVVIGPTWLVTHDRDGLVADDIGTELEHSPRLLAQGRGVARARGARSRGRSLPAGDRPARHRDRAAQNDVLVKAGPRAASACWRRSSRSSARCRTCGG